MDSAAEVMDEVVALRRQLHQNPELGLENPRTQQAILDALDGLPLEIVYEDSQSNPGAGVSALQKILLGEKPPIVFSSLSGVSNALIPITEEREIVNILLALHEAHQHLTGGSARA